MLRFSMMLLTIIVMTMKTEMPFHGYRFIPWIKVKRKRRRIVGKVLMLGRIAFKIVATTYATTRPQRTTFVSLSLRVDVASVKFVSLSVLIPMTIYRTVLAAFI